MQTTTVRTALSALFCTAALAAVGTVQAAPAPGDGNPHVNATTQKIWDNPDLTEPHQGCAYAAGLHRPGKRTF